MIQTLPAFFTSAPEDSAEGSRSGPRASLRSDGSKSAGGAIVSHAVEAPAEPTIPTAIGPRAALGPSPCGGATPGEVSPPKTPGCETRSTGRSFYDSLYTMLEKSIDVILPEAGR